MKRVLSRLFKYVFTFQRWLLFAFLVILGGIIVLSLLSYYNNKAFQNTRYWVAHTHSVIEQAERVASLSKDIQWESRTFFLAGDKDSIKPYYNVRENLLTSLLRLSKLTADNSLQQTRTKKLKIRLDSLIDFTDKMIQSNKIKDVSLNDYVLSKLKQNVFYAGISQQIEEIIGEENRLLEIRETSNNLTIHKNRNLFIALSILIFLILTLAFALINYNIFKRRKVEKKVAESERNFRILINSIKDLAIFTTDVKGTILDWYAGASNIKGYKNEEIIGKNISIFYTPDAIEKGEPQQNLKYAVKNGSYETQGWRVRKGGSVFWADVLITPIYDSDGTVQGFTKVTRDFTVHKRAEDEMRDALEKEKELNEMKSNFVSIASHEFRTPLSIILSSITLVEQYRTTETQDKRNKHIQRIKSSVTEMVQILDEFLSLEKIEKGKVSPKFETFRFKRLIEQVCDKFALEKQGRSFDCYHTGLEEICLDKGIVEHIATNLVSNAIKYSPDETKITIRTSVTKQTAELSVRDQGIGISREDQKHLFERFFRASNTGNVRGTGLGLHIIKRYADLTNATINVMSEVGKGSEFKVVFPTASE